VRKTDCGDGLETRLEALSGGLRRLTYRPQPVRHV